MVLAMTQNFASRPTNVRTDKGRRCRSEATARRDCSMASGPMGDAGSPVRSAATFLHGSFFELRILLLPPPESYWRVGLLTLHRYPCQNFESHPKLKTTYGPYIHSLYRLQACFINEGCVRSSFSPSFWTAIDCSVLGYRTPSFPPATA